MSRSCGTCDLITRRDRGEAPPWDSILRTKAWDVVHAHACALLGWIILVPRRHIESIDELTEAEGFELSALMRQVTSFLRGYVGCSKAYVCQFAEHPDHPHVHFHVVPRAPDLPSEHRGPGIFKFLGVDPEHQIKEAELNRLALALRAELKP